MRKKKEEDDDEIQLFRQAVSQLPLTQKYVCEYFCEMVGSIYHSLCMLDLGFVASLAITVDSGCLAHLVN